MTGHHFHSGVDEFHASWVVVDSVDGCPYNAERNVWVQPLPFSKPSLHINSTFTNHHSPAHVSPNIEFPAVQWAVVRLESFPPVKEMVLWNQHHEIGQYGLLPGESASATLVIGAIEGSESSFAGEPVRISMQPGWTGLYTVNSNFVPIGLPLEVNFESRFQSNKRHGGS